MYRLLTEEWKLSDKFSLALINLYGGHIWDVKQALMKLREMRENEVDFCLFDPDLTSNIANCFKDIRGNELGKERLINILKLLSKNGFYPLKEVDDQLAEVLSKNNVAGVVKKGSLIVGLPKSVWWSNKCKYGLVPTSQSTRLLIAEYLVDNNFE